MIDKYPDTKDHFDGYWSNHLRRLDTCSHCMNERREDEHKAICYGYPKCISCGCTAGTPCVYHRGSERYANELREREVAALEAIAEAKS
jgi:hypothetical protein